MKLIKLCVLAVLIALSGCASMERVENAGKPIEFVLDVPGKTKDQLFSASKSWIAETFVSGKTVIDDADKDSGRIIAKGNIKKPCSGMQCIAESEWIIGFTLRIDIKDGKLRTTYTNPTVITLPEAGHYVGLTYIAGSSGSESPVSLRGELDDATKGFKSLSDELKNYALKEAAANSNW